MLVAALVLLAATPIPFGTLAPGLDVAVVDAPQQSTLGDSKFTIVRVDPKLRKLRILPQKHANSDRRTGRSWAAGEKLSVVVNAGMFDPEGWPLGRLRANGVEVNPRWSKDKAVLAFDPVDPKLPAAAMLDREADALEAATKPYRSFLQGIRMMDRKGHPRWQLTLLKKWSMVVAGVDDAGRVLFVHTRSPYPVRVFIDQLLALPLDLKGLMYLEGGPEATLFVQAKGETIERIGSYETGFFESDDNERAWGLPNVIGVE